MAARRRSAPATAVVVTRLSAAASGGHCKQRQTSCIRCSYTTRPQIFQATTGTVRPYQTVLQAVARAHVSLTHGALRRASPLQPPPPAVTAPPSRRNIAQEGATEASYSHQTWSQKARARMRTDERTDDLRGLPLEAAASALCQRPSPPPPLGRHPPPAVRLLLLLRSPYRELVCNHVKELSWPFERSFAFGLRPYY